MAKGSNFFEDKIVPYPGFWLNFLAIIAAIVIILISQNSSRIIITHKGRAIQKAVNEILTEKRIKNYDLSLVPGEIEARVKSLLFPTPEDEKDPNTPELKQYENAVWAFLKSVNILSLLYDPTKSNNDIATSITKLSTEWLEKSNTWLRYSPVHYLWIVIALIYLAIVGIAYAGEYIQIENGEPILNIIDVGLYASLIEYTGGSKSPIIFVLSLSVAVALLDGTTRLGDFKVPRRMLFGQKGICEAISPTLLYFFALSTGIFWALLDEKIAYGLNLLKFIGLCFADLLKTICAGIALFVTMFLIMLIVRKTNIKLRGA